MYSILFYVDCKTVVFFCERGRPSICERKAVWSECENGEGDWGETLPRASQARIALMALRAFRKRPKTTVLQSMFYDNIVSIFLKIFR